MAKFTFMPDDDGFIEAPFYEYTYLQSRGAKRSHLVEDPYGDALCGFRERWNTTSFNPTPGYPFTVCPKCARLALLKEAKEGGA
jgi:hypothetical protein